MNGNANGSIAPSTNPNAPQSWFDLVVMPTMDPRNIIQTASFEDSTGTMRSAIFQRSGTWLQPGAGPWVQGPLNVSPGMGSTIANVTVPNIYDYASIEAANSWNTLHQMTPAVLTTLPLAVQQIMFLKAGTAFVNNLYLDWKVGVTATSVQLSFRDNSVTSGDFQNSGTATVPVFMFPPSATFGNTGRNFQVTVLRPGRFHVGLVVFDSTTAISMFEMEWIVLP
jgi:hypothetical protein